MRIVDLSPAALRGHLDRRARWLKFSERKGFLPARPPTDVVEDMLAMSKPLPPVRGVVGMPVFGADGTLVAEPGYHHNLGLHYEPAGMQVRPVPDRPGDAEVGAAKGVLQEWLCDFPFADRASRAHAVASALTPLVLEITGWPAHLFAVDAPTPGSGKGLLAETIGIMVGGCRPAVMTEARNEEETRKRITAALRDGSLVILLDNVSRPLESPSLAGVLTAAQWRDRVLSRSEMVEVPNRSLWLVTGNNLDMNAEIARRTVWIRLDPRVDRPWERSGFRHEPLGVWVKEQRPELVRALVVLVRDWISRGRPAWQGKPLGSHERWCQVVGGILDAVGIPGFMSNREDLYRRADAETDEWRAFLAAWYERYGDEVLKAAELLPLVKEGELLPSVFARVSDDASDRTLASRLGKALAQRRGRRYGSFVVESLGQDPHRKGALYRVERVEGEGQRSARSADVPQEQGPVSDTNAEHAEGAERNSLLAREHCEANEFPEGIAKRVPHVPHPPQPDTDQAPAAAEHRGEGATHVPQDVLQTDEVLAVGEKLGWPALVLGRREIGGSERQVGVGAGRFAWEQAVRFWPPGLLGELLERLREMHGGGFEG